MSTKLMKKLNMIQEEITAIDKETIRICNLKAKYAGEGMKAVREARKAGDQVALYEADLTGLWNIRRRLELDYNRLGREIHMGEFKFWQKLREKAEKTIAKLER